jgi:serine/threonine protein kinase
MSNPTCPSREEIAAYLASALDDASADRFASHVEDCQACQAALQTMCEFDDTLLEQLRSPAVDSPYVGESECERAVERAAVGIPDSSNAKEGKTEGTEELPEVFAHLTEYRTLGKVGEGGMGSVYRAVHTRLGRTVAIKLLLKHRSKDPKAVARFEREMKAVGGLSHPNIVRAYDAREVDGTLFLVMEFLEGLSLGDVLRSLGATSVAEACELIRQAALGLSCAHGQGLIHRDVKPSNLMLDQHGQVKVLDLGLALLQTDDSKSGETTFSGQMMGTADYMAPEQINDAHEVDARADIYSLGCTLYAMLTGHPPFNGQGRHGSHVAKILAHLEQEPVPVRDLCADVPPKLATLLQRMMAKKPENRLATATEVAEALRPFCKGADLPAMLARARTAVPQKEISRLGSADASPKVSGLASAETSRQRRRPIWTVVAVAAAFVITVALGIIIRIRDQDGRETVIHVPDDAQVSMEQDADSAAVAAPKPAADGTADVAKPGEMPAVGQASLALQSSQPISVRALTMQPESLPGVQSWTLETPAHRGPINSVAYSPDGQILATGGEDSTVRVWESSSAKLLRVLHGHDGIVWRVAWSHDGKRLASASEDGTVRLWDPATGQLFKY